MSTLHEEESRSPSTHVDTTSSTDTDARPGPRQHPPNHVDLAGTNADLDGQTGSVAGSDPDSKEESEEPEESDEYPSFTKTMVIMACIMTTTFLNALDKLIVGVAIPKITDEFDSLGDVGWYGSAYLLTTCAFNLSLGRLYTFYDPKWMYLLSLVIFEVGSAISGAAGGSSAFIVGRAVAGVGNAGLFQGAITIFVYIVPLPKRPQYMGFFASVFAVASAVGPLLGGAFTDGPGWRWCFYINLPFGGVVLVALAYFLRIPAKMMGRNPTTTWRQKVARLDPIGTACFLPCVVCLLLALQWGGVTYRWSDARIVVLLTLSGVLAAVFVLVQAWKQENALVPPRIFLQRSIFAGIIFSFSNGGAMQTLLYFLPIWFQAIKGVSAIKSGIMVLPIMLSMVVTGMVAGVVTKKIGYYAQWLYVSTLFASVGAGLITTFTPSTGHPEWIGYQVLFGMGMGFGMQQASLAAQTVLSRRDVATGAALMMFSQTLSGSIFVSVSNNLFDNTLTQRLAGIPGIEVGTIAKVGATELRAMVPTQSLPRVSVAYNAALRTTFYTATALACVGIVGAVLMEWVSVKKDEKRRSSESVAEKGKSGKDIEAIDSQV
ncbi:hypothetical protein H2204_001999 [Knufia peltigerae]|uniref:Major facilitator superfamily (MFS) profile domain-containing protein n=1 Tax=Knufia peltigerae TaxID=1002370 RepID=A0AA39D3K5_9EURO|nr:hypothetical protein H2204_001999 [Knufia peltigerae]